MISQASSEKPEITKLGRRCVSGEQVCVFVCVCVSVCVDLQCPPPPFPPSCPDNTQLFATCSPVARFAIALFVFFQGDLFKWLQQNEWTTCSFSISYILLSKYILLNLLNGKLQDIFLIAIFWGFFEIKTKLNQGFG